MARRLDNSNSSVSLQVNNLYPIPQDIQGFSTEDMFSAAEVKPVEVMIGVDGKKSTGFLPMLKEVTLMMQADSQSNDIFVNWFQVMDATRSSDFDAELIIRVQGTRKSYACTNGSLTSYSPTPKGGKVLGPRSYTITFESIYEAPF